MRNYQPVNCEFHDVIEACATLQKPIIIVAKNSDGSHSTIHAIVSDVFARGGVEYLKTQCKQLIRLDDVISVDGHETYNFS